MSQFYYSTESKGKTIPQQKCSKVKMFYSEMKLLKINFHFNFF